MEADRDDVDPDAGGDGAGGDDAGERLGGEGDEEDDAEQFFSSSMNWFSCDIIKGKTSLLSMCKNFCEIFLRCFLDKENSGSSATSSLASAN